MEGDDAKLPEDLRVNISIHTLRMEGDDGMGIRVNLDTEFQSTPSAWRVTVASRTIFSAPVISIHTLRVEGDLSGWSTSRKVRNISIHTLRVEGDHIAIFGDADHNDFNPHPPRGG